MLIDNNASKVLKYFIKFGSTQSKNTIVDKVNLSNSKTKNLDLIDRAIEDLLETNCITIVSADMDYTFYKLTNRGKMYFKTKRRDNIKMLLNGVVFPIIVAFITALITALVTTLLTLNQPN